MPTKARTPPLSKLSRPRLFGAEPRERLFARLDLARQSHRAACVIGPPGAGKTTLVAGWLDARAAKGLWVQIDSGDADLATFFHYLGQAAAPFARRGQRPLPALMPAFQSDVAAFGRRYFRELFSRLPRGAVVTLDNYQEVSADSLFHGVIADAVEEVPPGSLLVVVSRADPPACYARLRANRAVLTIPWEDLRLTQEEARAVAHRQYHVDDDVLDGLHAQCDGWAAGLILMLESATQAPRGPAAGVSRQQAVFDYFAGTLFDRASEALRHMLMSVALLPTVRSDWAESLSGDPSAGTLLESLHRRHFFTQRRDDGDGSYQFHALFQAFLQARARRGLVEANYRDLVSRTAAVLLDAGEVEAGFGLLCEAGDWARAADVLQREAERMMAVGRWRPLGEAISRLPGRELQARPWLQYWYGEARIPASPEDALRIFEGAHEAFRLADDLRGQCLSAAGVLDAIVSEWRHQARARPWIETLSRLIPSMTLDGPREELRLLCAFVIPCAQMLPGHPSLPEITERILALVPTCEEPNMSVWALTGVMEYVWISGPARFGHRADQLLESLLSTDELAPVISARAWRDRSLFRSSLRDLPEAIDQADRAFEIARSHGALEEQQAFLALYCRGLAEFVIGDAARVKNSVDALERLSVPDLPGFRYLRTQLKAFAAAMRGDTVDAIAGCLASLADCDEANVYCIRITARSLIADWMLSLGDEVSASGMIESMATLVRGIGSDNWHDPVLLALRFRLAEAASRHDEARMLVTEALAHSRHWDGTAFFSFIRFTLRRLCTFALEHGIETDHARELIQRYGLRPYSPDLETWPWPVKVRALGHFDLTVDGQPPAYARKSPRRLLQLLQAIIAFGAREVPARKLIDALWPDEDADNATRSLEMALVRLRRLLGRADLVTVQDGRVTLDAGRCWVDALVFERMSDPAATEADVERACALYQGAFLAQENDAPWALPMRERLRSRFLQCVQVLGNRFEANGQWDRAAAWYQRGVEADPLMEALHQALIRCYFRAGRRAEALGAYRRLRDTLSVVLGIAPSPASEALYAALYEGP